MKTAIVTGATGFLGAALCRELSDRGIKVFAIVRKKTDPQKIKNCKGIEIISCDMNEYYALDRLIANYNIDVVYHMAWSGTSGEERGNYRLQVDNVKYSCELLEAVSRLKCKRIVFAASIMEYEVNSLMRTEVIPSINTIYSTGKLAADYMMRALAGAYDIEYICGLISNVYGPGEMSARLINTSIRKMLKKEHCSFSTGDQNYDFIYIDDAVKAFAAIGECGIKNRTYYIGNSHSFQLKDYLVEIKNQIDQSIDLGFGEVALDIVSLTYNEFDRNALERDTGFVPMTDFSTGIKKTIEWIKDNERF